MAIILLRATITCLGYFLLFFAGGIVLANGAIYVKRRRREVFGE
jgi:hypothetical protein